MIAIRQGGWRGFCAVALAGGMGAALNTGHWTRNYKWCGSPFMPAADAYLYRAESHSPSLVISNLTRNAAVELAGPAEPLNKCIERAMVRLHEILGVGLSDPRITYPGHQFVVRRSTADEDLSGNPFHLLLLTCAAIVTLVSGRKDRNLCCARVFLVAALCSGFFLFCAMVKWQPFHVRLHLPLFVLGAPLVGIWLERIKWPYARNGLMGLLMLIAFLLVILNPGHPLIGRRSIFRHPREAQYFANRPSLYEPYRKAVDLIARRDFSRVGISRGPVWEYPLWVMLHDRTGRWPCVVPVPPAGPVANYPVPLPDDLSAVLLIPPRPGVEVSTSLDGPADAFDEGIKVVYPR